MNYLLWLEDRRFKKKTPVDLKSCGKKNDAVFSLLDFSLNTNTPLFPEENLLLFAEPVVPKEAGRRLMQRGSIAFSLKSHGSI